MNETLSFKMVVKLLLHSRWVRVFWIHTVKYAQELGLNHNQYEDKQN